MREVNKKQVFKDSSVKCSYCHNVIYLHTTINREAKVSFAGKVGSEFGNRHTFLDLQKY